MAFLFELISIVIYGTMLYPLRARLLFLVFFLPCIPLLVSFVYPVSFNPVLSMLEEGNYTFLFLAFGAALIYYRARKKRFGEADDNNDTSS